jgi:hypothetical protein
MAHATRMASKASHVAATKMSATHVAAAHMPAAHVAAAHVATTAVAAASMPTAATAVRRGDAGHRHGQDHSDCPRPSMLTHNSSPYVQIDAFRPGRSRWSLEILRIANKNGAEKTTRLTAF